MENKNELDLMELFSVIWKRKRFIAIFTSIVTIGAITYSLLATEYYRSYISIYPISEESGIGGSLGQLQGLASSFGVNLGSSSATPYYIPDIVRSRKLGKAIITKKWHTEKFDKPVDLITYWEINETTGFSLKTFIKKLFISENKSNITEFIDFGLIEWNDRFIVQDEDSGLIIITVTTEERQLSADIVNYIASEIKKHITEEIMLQSTKYRQFIEERLKETKLELSISEDKLTEFRSVDSIIKGNPQLELALGRLMRNVEVNQQVYITLKQQYELAKIDELKEKPIINILDKGEAQTLRDKPQRTVITILGFIIGFMMSIVLIYIKTIKEKIKK
jgi:tyrosine-protein kinase Etk/Wzc